MTDDTPTALGNRILKVNHAGEQGAINIYLGQILMARITARSMLHDLGEFKQHEEKHRAIFWEVMQRRGVARCRSYHLCALGGFALGIVSGLLGKHAIASTTVAVERVVLDHLVSQIAALGDHDPEATVAIEKIVAEEREHHDRSRTQLSPKRFWTFVFEPIVATATETVIWVGMRA